MKKPRILMVEDEPAILHANKTYFEGQGYEVVAATSVLEAEAALVDLPPDIIILDVMLLDGSGFELCRMARAITNAPVLFLTALGDNVNEENGFALGGDDYVVKPYQMNILGARVAALLRRTGIVSNMRLEFPPLSVDIRIGQCLLEGNSISLSPMELRLLYFFMEHCGRRMERDYIYEQVWGTSAQYGGHTVKEHVYRLRKKLNMSSKGSSFQIMSEGNAYLFGKVNY